MRREPFACCRAMDTPSAERRGAYNRPGRRDTMARRRRRDVLTHSDPEADAPARPEESAGPILSLDEIADLYPEERILLRITAYDEDNRPSHGEVVGHW